MDSDGETEDMCPPLDVVLDAGKINSMPEKSRNRYEACYSSFMERLSDSNTDSLSEDVLLAYFKAQSEKYKSSSLWAHYSMLRTMLNIKKNINIEGYTKLRAFLKRLSVGYQATKMKTFTPSEIHTFINEAPDDKYLATKVAVIMGVTGDCKRHQLHSMNVEDCQDLGSVLLVSVPTRKKRRRFKITGDFYKICKKYADLRPRNVGTNSFFLNYANGKCTTLNIGLNRFGAMGKEIATYLNLPNSEMYTGRSFNKSSAGLYVDAQGDIKALEKSAEWSAAITEDYTDEDPINIKEEIEDTVGETVICKMEDGFSEYMDETYEESFTEPVKVCGSDEGAKQSPIDESVKDSTMGESSEDTRRSIKYMQNVKNETINLDLNSMASIHFTNCSNFTINFYTNDGNKRK